MASPRIPGHSPRILGSGSWWGSGTACPHSLGSVTLSLPVPPAALDLSPAQVTGEKSSDPELLGTVAGQCHQRWGISSCSQQGQ